MHIKIPDTLANISNIQNEYLDPSIATILTLRRANIVQKIKKSQNFISITIKAIIHSIDKRIQSSSSKAIIKLRSEVRERSFKSFNKIFQMSLISSKEMKFLSKKIKICAMLKSILKNLKAFHLMLIINISLIHITDLLINNTKEIFRHILSRSSLFRESINMSIDLSNHLFKLRLICLIKLIEVFSRFIIAIFIKIVCGKDLLINISTSHLTIHQSRLLTRGNKVKVLTKIINSFNHSMARLKAIQFSSNRVLQRNRLKHTHGINLFHICIKTTHIIVFINNIIICSLSKNISSSLIGTSLQNLFIHLIF